jgi:TPR repeat protein
MSAALWFRPMREKIAGFQWSLLVSVAAFFFLFAWIQLRDFADRRAAGFKNESDYMAVQLWAKDHTPPDALFMPDPSILYGWRDFANRSSFGNIREWGFVAIAYTPDNAKYLEGKNRLKIFGIDIDGITEEQIRNSKTRVLGDQLVLQAKARFYSSTPSDLQALCDAYGIDYFIMEKKSLPAQRFKQMTDSFQTAFQNDSFIVFGRNTIQGMIDRYDQLLKTSPENVHLAFKLALIHHRLNNKDAAIKYYRQAIDGNPDFPEAVSNLALLYFEMGNDQEAVRLYKQLIGIKPDDPEAHYNLACLTARGGMTADAVMYLEKAIRNGYNKYHLIRSDPDLNNIRGMDEYKRLMTEDRKQSADGGGKSSILEQ